MPSFPVTEVATQVSQSITQDALIQNTGTSAIYLDAESSVSPASYGLSLAPRSTVNWPANRPLWASTAPGSVSTMSVLYNAAGAGLSEVAAVVSGEVEVSAIGAPVNVQGGGAILVDRLVNVPYDATGTQHVDVTVPGPPGNLTYYGLRIDLRTVATGSSDPIIWADVLDANGVVQTTTVIGRAQSIGALGVQQSFGSSRHIFTVPMISTYPYTLRLRHYGGGTSTGIVAVRVSGVANAPLYPQTDPTPSLENGAIFYEPNIPWTMNMGIWFPPTFHQTMCRVYQGAGSSVVSLTLYAVDPSGAAVQIVSQAQNWERGSTGSPPPQSAFHVPLPGLGRPLILASTSASNTGSGFLTYNPTPQ